MKPTKSNKAEYVFTLFLPNDGRLKERKVEYVRLLPNDGKLKEKKSRICEAKWLTMKSWYGHDIAYIHITNPQFAILKKDSH